MSESDQSTTLEHESEKRSGQTGDRLSGRSFASIADLKPPPLKAKWFHAIDNPIADPISIRRARDMASKRNSTPPPPHKKSLTKNWLPFSKRDSDALEKVYKEKDLNAKVTVNEDRLFEVDVSKRIIYPIYWEGPTYEVRRATWFIQSDNTKWIPCEEDLAEQIELGYSEQKAYELDFCSICSSNASTVSSNTNDPSQDLSETSTIGKEKMETPTENQPAERQWNLDKPYSGQYIVYTGSSSAWILYNTVGSMIAKKVITRFTNNTNFGGTRLLRGYREVQKQNRAKTESVPKTQETQPEAAVNGNPEDLTPEEVAMKREAEDYENEESEAEDRNVDHLVFVIHGIGQKLTERLGQNFVHDVNTLRKTLKTAYTKAMEITDTPEKPNGIQVLPVLWRHKIQIGMPEGKPKRKTGFDDGYPTLDELTLDGAPNIRLVVSDVIMDVPLYLTEQYRDQMASAVTNEINRVYRIFIRRNPEFIERKGRVSLVGHSLGSLLAFDILCTQPEKLPTMSDGLSLLKDEDTAAPMVTSNQPPALIFPVHNFFAVGSPLGVILLLRGSKIASRKLLTDPPSGEYPSPFDDSPTPALSSSTSGYCYPALTNLYNVFHRSDPVAYRIEPLIARQYSGKLKPAQITYIKGGLKSVIDAGLSVGTGIVQKAGSIIESIKAGLPTSIFARGLSNPSQQTQQDTYPNGNDNMPGELPAYSSNESSLVNTQSRELCKSPDTLYSQEELDRLGAERLRMLNVTGRVDFCLQEGILENPYLSAISSHLLYWQDLDVAGFLIRELYREAENCTPSTL